MPAAGVAVTLQIVSGDGQTLVQHQRAQATVVRVLDGRGDPAAGAIVTFTHAAASGALQTFADGTAFPARGNDPGTLPLAYFHLAGAQTLTATVAGLAPVSFRMSVTPSPHLYDGLYACTSFLSAGGAPTSLEMDIADGQARLGSMRAAVDEASGLLRMSEGGGLSQTVYSGQIRVDALGRANLEGSSQRVTGGVPTAEALPWSCMRY